MSGLSVGYERRYYVFDQLEYLDKPEQWRGLRCFAVLESERIERKGRVKVRRLIAATSHSYRAELSGSDSVHAVAPVRSKATPGLARMLRYNSLKRLPHRRLEFPVARRIDALCS